MATHFEWDEAKRLANIRKHGFDFEGIEEVFAGPIFTVEDDRFEYGETRFVTLGLFKSRIVYIVHNESVDSIRIISVRKASKYEAEEFLHQIGYGLGPD